MYRTSLVAIVLLAGASAPAFADEGADKARDACAAELKRSYGVPAATVAKFQVGGSDGSYRVSGYANYQGASNVRVVCTIRKGRLSAVAWG